MDLFDQIADGMVTSFAKLISNIVPKIGVATILSICLLHAQLLFLFAILVCMDLATKWIALSYSHLVACKAQRTDVIACIKGINKARVAGVINSGRMKIQFLSKIAVYLIVAACSGVVDMMLISLHKPDIFLALSVGTLAATELLSCLENLTAANISSVARLLEKVKSKM